MTTDTYIERVRQYRVRLDRFRPIDLNTVPAAVVIDGGHLGDSVRVMDNAEDVREVRRRAAYDFTMKLSVRRAGLVLSQEGKAWWRDRDRQRKEAG